VILKVNDAKPALIAKLLLILVFSWAYCCFVSSQSDNFKFTRIDINEGLSHNQVNCILKDSKGFMWFGTLSGLNRYDGYHFKVFRHQLKDSTSINDNYINTLLEDHNGKIWVGTREGFVIYNPEYETFNRNIADYLHEMNIPAETIIDLVKDREGNVFFITGLNELYKFQINTGEAIHINIKSSDTSSSPSGRIIAVAENHEGNLWVISNAGLLELLDGKSYKVLYRDYTIYNNFPKEYLDYRLFVDTDDDLWIYATNSAQGLYVLDSGTQTFLHCSTNSSRCKITSNIIRGLVQDDNGLIWVGTDHGGINLINRKNLTIRDLTSNPYDERSLGQNTITVLYKDNIGIIWAGTFKKGVCYYHEDIIKFRLIKHQTTDPKNLNYDDVNCFSEDMKGNLWIGTNGGGLIYYDRSDENFIHYKHDPSNSNSLSNDVIVCMYMDSDEKLWIGTYFGGLDYFDGLHFTHYRYDSDDPQSISDDRVWDIYEDDDNQLWIGTLGGGVNVFDRKTGIFGHFRYADSTTITSDFIASITEDNIGNIWIGTAVGINVYNRITKTFTYYASDDSVNGSLSNDNINYVMPDSRGYIWVGTREGLNMYDRKSNSFKVFRQEDGLSDNSVFSIIEDLTGNLWLGTTNGLSCLMIGNKENADSMTFKFKNYDESDGLQGKEFNKGAAFRTRRGELVFGGTNGFNIFYPGNIKVNMREPDIVFTDFQIFNNSIGVNKKINGRIILDRSITQTKEIILKYHENVISLEFAALDYFQPEKNKYEYMLDGFNSSWTPMDANLRKATYTNLNPGEYVFHVKASNNDGYWNNSGAQLKITILPPFWKTRTAFVIYFFLIIGLLLLLRYLVVERERINHRIQQERVTAQHRHELDMLKIKFITNISHEFKTPLSLIITPLEKIIKATCEPEQNKQYMLMYRNARRLLSLVNKLLDFRRMEFQELKLNLTYGDIIAFAGDVANSFTDLAEKKEIDFSFHTSVKQLSTYFDQDKVEKIIFNLLSNAFKFTHEKGKVEVTIDVEDASPVQDQDTGLNVNSFVVLKVRDTGIGIPRENQDKVFERFFMDDNPKIMINQGTGIGLSLVGEFVKLHKGKIKVESEPGKGSEFSVWFPLIEEGQLDEVNRETSKELSKHSELEQLEENDDAKHGIPFNNQPLILLVEDNADFLFYLKDNLKISYNIIEATNGREGLQIARKKLPDLIVSDIVMPEMDGIELCRIIKSDKNTSHIPVILLTGRSSNKKRLEGFEFGADDYITKPFSFEILESRIRNLILQRETIRKSFQKRFELTPSDIQVTPLDEKLIQKALQIVENNLSDPDFSVDKLSREIGMSRVHLYKKLTSLTGKSPIEFIRIIRLRRAAQLLEKSQLSVSEIAYQVGFNNPKYFTKYFKSEYRTLPSEYAAEKFKRSKGPHPF
jgi:signal transduction histidine kinase/ligand-binding sensor domain-containing protein/DNA-binding response OmpR family regulator